MTHKVIHGDSAQELKKLADNSIDAVVTDPPYGIEFLAKEWDSNTGAVEIWSECLRVLKPGGYLLAFSAARTYHHLATNIESVGFEIRDQIMWLYASGFPKAQDIGKAIDKRGGMVSNNADTQSLKTILAELFTASGKSNTQINQECGFNAAGYLRQHDNGVDGWGYALPLNHKWQTLKQVLGCGDDYDKYFISSERAVVGTKQAGCFDQDFESHTIGARSKTVDITQPATQQANQWHGWKTALKPAHEPICMARKPFKGSTIDNVLTHGVGALNIDATRIGLEEGAINPNTAVEYTDYSFGNAGEGNKQSNLPKKFNPDAKGRFPSNVMGEVEGYQKFFYCPKVSRRERHRGFEQVNEIDNNTMLKQMGGYFIDSEGNKALDQLKQHHMVYVPTLGKFYVHGLKHEYEQWCKKNKQDPLSHLGRQNYNDGWHCEDANRKKDPLTHIDNVGNNHPTVKPVELMKYLVQLVTPQGAHVLDPFCGSGSTGMACKELGNTFTGIEQDKNYVTIAQQRIDATVTDPKYTLFE